MNDEVKQFNSISNTYASFVDEDPVRNFLHYPTVTTILGDIQNKEILDIGCGDGLFDRKLAKEYGARMTGYDKADDLISLAKNEENKTSLGIAYSTDDPLTFTPRTLFDESISVMVLSYAPDTDYLVNFFNSAYKTLKNGGRFISVIFNPAFSAFDTIVANRIFKQKNGKIEVHFLDPRALHEDAKFTALLTQFSSEDYAKAAEKSGFNKISWEKLYPTAGGIELLGKEFWQVCEEEQPYAVLVVEK